MKAFSAGDVFQVVDGSLHDGTGMNSSFSVPYDYFHFVFFYEGFFLYMSLCLYSH